MQRFVGEEKRLAVVVVLVGAGRKIRLVGVAKIYFLGRSGGSGRDRDRGPRREGDKNDPQRAERLAQAAARLAAIDAGQTPVAAYVAPPREARPPRTPRPEGEVKEGTDQTPRAPRPPREPRTNSENSGSTPREPHAEGEKAEGQRRRKRGGRNRGKGPRLADGTTTTPAADAPAAPSTE